MPEYELKVNIPERPQGEEIEVPPFGRVKNGSSKTVELSAEDAERFGNSHGLELKQTSDRRTAADKAAEDASKAGFVPGIAADAKPSTASASGAPKNKEGGDE